MLGQYFSALCVGLCEAVGVPLPELELDEIGLRKFTLRVGEVDVLLVHDEGHDASVVNVLIPFGVLPEDDALHSVRTLMEANFLMLEERNGASFSRYPGNGQLLFQYTCALGQISANQLMASILRNVRAAARWRRGEGPVARQRPHGLLALPGGSAHLA